MRVYGEGWDAEGLCHDHGSGLVADAGQSFKGIEVLRNLPTVLLDEDAAEF